MSLREHLYGEGAVPVGPERTKIVEQESEVLSWIMNGMKLSPNRYANIYDSSEAVKIRKFPLAPVHDYEMIFIPRKTGDAWLSRLMALRRVE